MSNNEPVLARIVKQYDAPLQRFAGRLLWQKHLAPAVVKEVFEELYNQNKLCPGPQLRMLLKNNTISLCQTINNVLGPAQAQSKQPL